MRYTASHMNPFVRILIGVIVLAIGAVMVIRTRYFLDFFGSIEWADTHLGGGGSNLLYKVIGIVFCFIGIIVATNLWDAFLNATLGSIFPHNV
jgi:hypothetical protein